MTRTRAFTGYHLAHERLYFLSDRDRARCIWAQRVDTATRRAVAAPFAADHMHQFRYSLNEGDPAAVGLAPAGGHTFYASFELQSNGSLAERRAATAR